MIADFLGLVPLFHHCFKQEGHEKTYSCTSCSQHYGLQKISAVDICQEDQQYPAYSSLLCMGIVNRRLP